MMEEVHQCVICNGRFSDAELLRTHVCPLKDGNEFIEIEAEEPDPFPNGTTVRKIKGYKYPGVVVSSFTTLKGERRYVVECTVLECAGMLHIYNGGQLERVE